MSNMTQTGLSPDSPFLQRFYAWVQERFPLSHGVLFMILFAAAAFTGAAAVGEGPLSLDWRLLTSFVGVWGFFLMLRVFDEHKDYARDQENHPERVLQSGLIRLGHLKAVGALAIAAQLGASLLADGAAPGVATAWWAVVMVWSALMAFEFFVKEWLEARLVLYALSHMLVMPLAVVWMAHLGSDGEPVSHGLVWLCVAAFCAGGAFEVTRKTRAPQEERPTVDSYARNLGLKGACLLIVALLALGAVSQVALLSALLGQGLHWGWVAGAVALAAFPAWVLTRFMAAPDVTRRKHNEAAVSLAMLGGYALVVGALVIERGAQWS